MASEQVEDGVRFEVEAYRPPPQGVGGGERRFDQIVQRAEGGDPSAHAQLIESIPQTVSEVA